MKGLLLLLLAQCFIGIKAAAYDYSNGPNGPANWGGTCNSGTQQSPIDITLDSIRIKPGSDLIVNYVTSAVAAKLFNDGLTPTVDSIPNSAGIIKISGVQYHLRHFHFHVPSEHQIFSDRFKMELHLVHETLTTPPRTAVVAILFKLGRKSLFLSQFFGKLPPPSPPNEKKSIDITLPDIDGPYFRYNGSLTTPPCSENVTWTVMVVIQTLSHTQLNQLKKAMPGPNARPPQPLNGRRVFLYLFSI